ncbi:uncharacterized protein VTP21DRAFT_11226 [Calcarisporiella thermophila]|uniref:uncharacterized protein n=1 Tax=Calcarisporiella thermophila TaxID=911321 RepID=UPI0037420A1C
MATMRPKFQRITRHIDDTLERETWATLNKKILAELIALCQERGLPTEGSKEKLINALLDWKQNTKPIPAPTTPRLYPAKFSSPSYERDLNSKRFSTLFLDDKSGQDELISYDELIIGKRLGSGGFKDCFAGVYRGKPVAIGELRVAQFTEEDIMEMKHEINVLKQLCHENIIRFIGVCTNAKHLCIVTELCEGDLFDIMRKTRKPNFSVQVTLMHDISLGVSYMHARRPSIIHRDLKSMNILISADFRAKINDFGLARIRPRANASLTTLCGTPQWQAPEFWSTNPRYSEKVDVYACGLIFWEILTWAELGYPYQDMTEHQLYEGVRDKGVRPSLQTLIGKYPNSLLELIQEMWHKDPKKRPSMNQVVERLAEYLA